MESGTAAFSHDLMVTATGSDGVDNMAAIYETTMALRFFGDDLNPEEITARLGCSPTFAAKKGGMWITEGGTQKIARTGFWRLLTENRKPGDLDAQIKELVAKCSGDLHTWADFTERFAGDMFCGLFMSESNEGETLSAESMILLGSRNLTLEMDIYDPMPSD